MFKKEKKVAVTQARIDSLIGVGTRIDGSIKFTGGLRVDGEIKGDVSADQDTPGSMLVLSEQGRIEGAIDVPQLVVNGTVQGPIKAREYVELQSKAKVTGDVRYGAIEIQQGAMVEGQLISGVGKDAGSKGLKEVNSAPDKEPKAQTAAQAKK
jgi:cytoskeletal protein CcmA (bactofilin family)